MGRRISRLRLSLALVAVVAAASSQVALASAAIRPYTTANFGAGGSAPLASSPVAACLGADPNRFVGVDLNGFVHVNATGVDTQLHLVADLDLTFTVGDYFSGELFYEGHAELAIDEFVEMNWSPDQGYVSPTVPVLLTAPDGSSVPTLWRIEIWTGFFETESGNFAFVSFGWGEGYVSCA